MYKVNKIRSSVDRFIPHRAGENFDVSYYNITNDPQKSDKNEMSPITENNYAHHIFKKKAYRESLWNSLVPKSRKILNFSSPKIERVQADSVVQQWPVKPRTKPLIQIPVTLLDMPDLNTNLCYKIVDWGSKGHIASIYNNDVHIWHPDLPKPYIYKSSLSVEQCVRWNRAGTRLAVSIPASKLAIMDLCSNKTIFVGTCCKKCDCSISSLQLNVDDAIITGCTKGKLTVWFQNIKIARSLSNAHNGPIISIKFSCNEKYLATSGIDGAVRIWLWPEITEYLNIVDFALTKMFAWHPWRESILAVATSGYGNATLSIWNVGSQKKLHTTSPPEDTLIDAITFNKISGELVVSYWYQNKRSYDDYMGKNMIVVLSNLNKVTDAIEWHAGRVPYLLWGPGGTRLATASADESLCIWDFFGHSTRDFKPKKKKRFTTNPVKNLNSFSQCIR